MLDLSAGPLLAELSGGVLGRSASKSGLMVSSKGEVRVSRYFLVFFLQGQLFSAHEKARRSAPGHLDLARVKEAIHQKN